MNNGVSKQKKFNVLDWMIIIVLILCVAVFVLRYTRKEDIKENAIAGTYAISFTVKNVRYTTSDAFVKGDAVYVATDDTYIGIFERLDSNNPSAYYAEDPNGGLVKKYYPEGTRVDLSGTIISEGVMNDDGYFAGGSYYLAPGKELTIYTGHIYVDVVLSGITEYTE